MQDSKQQNDSENQISEALKESVSDYLNGLPWSELDIELPLEEITEDVVNQLSEDPAFQSASEQLRIEVESAIDDSDTTTIGQFIDKVGDRLGAVLHTYITDNQDRIWQLAITAAGKALSYSQVQQMLQGKAEELILQLVSNWITGKEPEAARAIAFVGSIVSTITTDEEWRTILSTTIITLSRLNPLLNSGVNLVAAALNVIDIAGYATSHGARFSLEQKSLNGTTYYGTTVQGVAIFFDVNPSLSRPPVILTTGKTISSAATKVATKIADKVPLPGLISGLAKTVINGINNALARDEVVEYATSAYGSSMLGSITDKLLRDFVMSIFDWVSTQRDKLQTLLSEGRDLLQVGLSSMPIPGEVGSDEVHLPPLRPIQNPQKEEIYGRKYVYRLAGSSE